MVTVEHLSKRYGKKQAVDDLSFKIELGRVTGFLGPNGAGKSTAMRLMLGLDPGHGTTVYDGKPLDHYAQPSQVVGILLEAKAFHPTRSARNHLRVLAAAGNIPDSRVDEVLGIVGLSDVAKKKPGKFSLGMSQRLGIAAAILGKPKYLLLDEPANGLDPEGIAWLREFIKDYADQGNAVFISSHLLSEMSQMADDIVVIGQGKMIANASVADLLSHNGAASVYVRSPKLPALQNALEAEKLAVTKFEKGLKVTATTTDKVGDIAYRAGLAIHELAPHGVSLEDAFLELTADAQEYKAKPGAKL